MTKKFAKVLFNEFKIQVSHLDVVVSFTSLCRGYHEIIISSSTGFISSPVFAHVDRFLRLLGKDWLDVHISKTHKLIITLS